MRRHFHSARDFILPIIDFFYPPFRRLMTKQAFRYLTCGAGNTLLGLLAYYISYKFIFSEKTFDIGFFAFKGHIASLIVSFCVSFPIGFFLAKYVVFSDSGMKGRIQLFRYLMICLFNLGLNYILLKILVERFGIYPVLAQVITILFVVVFSYIAQRNYSFKATPPAEEGDQL
jgi:putative flippase GtrA